MNFLTKCFCLPEVTAFAMALLAFVCAYILYRLLLFVLKRLARREGVWKKLAKEIRFPLLCLLLEIASLISLYIFDLPERYLNFVAHVLNVFIMGTLGWFAVAILHSCYQNYTDRMGNSEKADSLQRSLFTQILFLYRFSMFIICAITAALILLTFPYIKSVGVGILGSAGIAGLALGIAARPILLNLMAGFQIAVTKTIKIGDTVFIEGDSARVEAIHLTHVIVRTWDLRRIIVPISYFIDRPFQNWDATDPEIQGSVFLYCDYSLPVDGLRKKMADLVKLSPHWNQKTWNIHVTNCTEHAMEIRVSASANDASSAFELRAFLREKLLEFIHKEYPGSLPCIRNYQFSGLEPEFQKTV